MATLLFAVAAVAVPSGSLIAAGTIGGVLFVAAGGIIDSQLIFKPQSVDGPRIGDMKITGGEEGSLAWTCIGPATRVAGTLIYVSPYTSHKHTHGGGLFGGGEYITYSYTLDLAVAVCQHETVEPDGSDAPIEIIWANGRKFYDPSPDVTATSSLIVVTYTGIQTIETFPDYEIYAVFTSPSAGPDLTEFRSGHDIVITGCSDSYNNFTGKCHRSYNGSAGATVVEVLKGTGSIPGGHNEGPGATITLFEDLPEFSSKLAYAVTVYNGNDTQLPDPIMEAAIGAGLVPGYRGTTYFVIERFHVTPFGNQIPSMSELVRQAADGMTVGEAMAEIVAKGDGDPDFIEYEDLDGAFEGVSFYGYSSTGERLATLMTSFDILCQRTFTGVRFFYRKDANVIVIDEEEWGTRTPGNAVPEGVEITDASDIKLVDEVVVNYIDPERDWQNGSTTERSIISTVHNSQSVSLPVTMSAKAARGIAARLLQTQRAARKKVRGSLPPSRQGVREGDILQTTIEGKTIRILLTQVDTGANYIVEVEGFIDLYTGTDFDDWVDDDSLATGFGGTDLDFPTEQVVVLLDVPPLVSDSVNVCGAILGAYNTDIAEPFDGSIIYRSTATAGTYTQFATVGAQASVGKTTSIVPTGFLGHVDYKSTFTFTMFSGEALSSCTVEEVLSGKNWFWVMGEIMGIATIVSTGVSNTYTASVLIRGMLGTASSVVHASANERIVLLSDDAIDLQTYSLADIGLLRYYKAVDIGGDVDDAEYSAFTLFGNTCRPMPVCCVKGFRHKTATNYWSVRWQRQTRTPTRLFAGFTPSMDGDLDQYEVEVWTSGFTTLKRTITVSGNELVYNDTDQITDFGSVQTTLRLDIYALSSFTPRGKVTRVTITQ